MSNVTDLFARAQGSLAGGVSSSTRVNRALGHPLYFQRAEGCRLWDLDGREYIDLCCSHGATLVGHNDPRIRAAVERVLATNAACSYENELQTELAELICKMVPACERVRIVGSGTEATMHAIRLARAYTGRQKLLKIEGNFHGYHDQVMFSIGTPADKLGPETSPTPWPGSTGIAPGMAEQ
ncbi:MAG: aminotransferase class III-fold pyridoxal phosphate-dependent enzyme, partial [Planctomycetes bacterium]|nr:aminotransferase class III-fold pyridoxal phosphate-dependent enzyme [Planctomycetota bacterium]